MTNIFPCLYEWLTTGLLIHESPGSTYTTRHGQGYLDVPEAFRRSFLAVEPDAYIGARPTVDLADDLERAFRGKSLVFLEVPAVAYPRFFAGYIGSITPGSRELIS